jgi:5-methylcytosine-specific restriction enzyme subunit McrC
MNAVRQQQTIMLKERVATECRLALADVDFLLAEHRAHIELAPTGRRGRYRLTPTGHVGTIVGPSCRFVIRPKLPIRNLFYLLDRIGSVPLVEDHTAAVPGTEVLDFLAGQLAQLLAERAAAGLHRAYAGRADQGPFLLGKLDLAAQLRDPNGRKDQFHCQYEDFTADVPCNQIPKATAERVLGSPLLGEEARAALRRALSGFAGISTIPLDPDSYAAAAPDRLTEAYRPLLDLCRLLAEGLTAGPAAGRTACPAFLLDMERVFECYVTQGVRRAFPPGGRYDVAVQPLFVANQPLIGQPDISMRPDIVVHRTGQPVLVVDAKWKSLIGSPLVTEDLYQVLAYGAALKVRRALLVYPGRRDRSWTYSLARVPVRVEIRTLRVTGSREDCTRSLGKLGRAVRLFIRRA